MRDYLALLDDKSMSDLTLVVQGRNIYVHKAMLAARSSHFKNMLSSGMRECEDGQVLMPDAPYEAMKSLLVYLYSGDAPLTPDSAMPVLRLADRYMVTGLKRLCESVLVSAISKESIVALLEAAFRYSAEHLAAACLEYCVQHFAELVLTEEYMNLDAALMIKVQQAVAPHVCRPRLPASTTHHHGLALMPQIFCAPGRSSHS
jgi:RCC1 and BTB domain-containing protein